MLALLSSGSLVQRRFCFGVIGGPGVGVLMEETILSLSGVGASCIVDNPSLVAVMLNKSLGSENPEGLGFPRI